jgi:hypothetical protein
MVDHRSKFSGIEQRLYAIRVQQRFRGRPIDPVFQLKPMSEYEALPEPIERLRRHPFWTCNGCVPVFCEHYSP